MPDLFKGGELNMAAEPLVPTGTGQLWGDCAVNRWILIFAVIIFVIELYEIIRVYPPLLRCLSRWKGNADIEHSVSLARTRNTVALVAGLAFCIMADRWGLVAPDFKMRLAPGFHLPVTIGLVVATALLHRLFYIATPFRSTTSEYAQTLRHTIYNYHILLTSLMLVSVLPLAVFRVPDTAVRIVLLAECAVFFLLHLIRTGQILRSRSGTLATILYLCGLEILPIGILIFACTL